MKYKQFSLEKTHQRWDNLNPHIVPCMSKIKVMAEYKKIYNGFSILTSIIIIDYSIMDHIGYFRELKCCVLRQ